MYNVVYYCSTYLLALFLLEFNVLHYFAKIVLKSILPRSLCWVMLGDVTPTSQGLSCDI